MQKLVTVSPYRVRAYKGSNEILGMLVPRTLGGGAWLNPRNTPVLHSHAEVRRCGTNRMRQLGVPTNLEALGPCFRRTWGVFDPRKSRPPCVIMPNLVALAQTI